MNESDTLNESLLILEEKLKAKLNPVEPSQNFVVNLRKALEESDVAQQQRRTAASLLTIALGLIVGLAIFLIGKKFLVTDETPQAV